MKKTYAVHAALATVGLAVAGWCVTIPRMSGMDMGVATTLGSFPFFISLWVPMMAAMMLPGVTPAALRLADVTDRPAAHPALRIPPYVGAYLGVWALFGVLVFALYRPHATTTAGAIVIAAGVYELAIIAVGINELLH